MTQNKKPPFRKLKGYAFDPSLSDRIDTAFINNMVYKVTWEDNLKEGPIGDYIEVIDYDPTLKKFYKPVDLNSQYILAQDGLEPSESNPQFHQQMVYAVAMTTIKNFEDALGRPILWCQRKLKGKEIQKGIKPKTYTRYVKRLRIYPHAFRDANAYYSPQKKALLFGYFSSQPAEPTLQMPNSQIFTCLSHDIIAHETTHAILDGIYNNYIDDTNPDTLAFHEAFADIVALFQHFTFPEVLKHQIAKTRGDLTSQNLLGQLAQEFGSAIGSYGSLRDAIGYIDKETKKWKQKEPDGDEYQTLTEPHARGSILVSAVFEAFLTIYKSRAADLLRIATGGTGILPQGELHPDLVNRLSIEASKSAGHILKMCIRAIDYCPPVDITFGDYLRAIITADTDLVADDNRDYRLVFIDAFRRRGIYPTGIKSLSVESLRYVETENGNLGPLFKIIASFLREFSSEIIYADAVESHTKPKKKIIKKQSNQSKEYYKSLEEENEEEGHDTRKEIFEITRDYIVGRFDHPTKKELYGLHRRFFGKFMGSDEFQKITGLVFNMNWKDYGINTSNSYGSEGPSFWVHGLKLASRVGPGSNKSNQIILSLTQNAGIRIITDKDGNKSIETFVPGEAQKLKKNEFIMTGGVTLIFDLDTLKLKYAISKPLLDINSLKAGQMPRINEKKVWQLHDYYNTGFAGTYNAHFSVGKQNSTFEPFSFLHNH